MGLNDNMPRAVRNRLLKPFVDKLPNTVAPADVEKERAGFIILETGRRVISLLCSEHLKREDFARQCREAPDLTALAKALTEITMHTPVYAACSSLLTAIDYASRGTRKAYAIDAPSHIASAIASAVEAHNSQEFWTIAARILDEAIRLSHRPRLLKDCRPKQSLPLAA